MSNVCPVCDYNGLQAPPYNKYMYGSDEICPCCGFQFAPDDFPDKESVHAEWRAKWVAGGCRWFSKFRQPPPGWNPVVLRLDYDESDEEL